MDPNDCGPYGLSKNQIDWHFKSINTISNTIIMNLETGEKLLDLDFLDQKTNHNYIFEVDSRLGVLASEALMNLPKALKTLLEALHELKKDIISDRARQWANVDAQNLALLESFVNFLCRTMDYLNVSLKENPQDFEIDLKIKDQVREALFKEYKFDQVTDDPKQWAILLKELIRKHNNNEIKNIMVHSEVSPIFKDQDHYVSIGQSESAIKNSVLVRERLKNLNAGEFKSIFEEPLFKKEISSELPVRLKAAGSYEPNVKTLRFYKNLLKDLNSEFDKIKLRRKVFIDDSIADFVENLKKFYLEPHRAHYTDSATLLQVDANLQKEINLILSTLSVDKKSLDLYLRSIKNDCRAIQNAAIRESVNAMHINILKWKLQIQDSFNLIHT